MEGSMLVATFNQTTGWAGKSITYEDKQFILEGHGAISSADVLAYDRQAHLSWASAGLREWVDQVAQADRATLTSEDAAAPSTGQPNGVGAAARLGVAGFVLSLAGILLPILWPVGLALSWRALVRLRRDDQPHGLALAGLIISSIGILAAIAIPLVLRQG
jgi:hypothetical protein